MSGQDANALINRAIYLQLILTKLPLLLAQCSHAHWVAFDKLDLLDQLPKQVVYLIQQFSDNAIELKSFAETLNQYEMQLEMLLTALGISILLQNQEDKLIAVYNRQRPCPELVSDTVHWSSTFSSIIRNLQQQAQHQKQASIAELNMQEGSQMRWYRYAAFPWYIRQLAVEGVLTLILDISPQYLTTAFLNSPNFFYLKQFAEHSPAIVALVSYALDRFLFLNETFQRVTGYQAESYYRGDMNYLTCVPDTHLIHAQQQLRTLLIEHQLTNIEMPLLDANGQIKYYLSNFFPIYNENQQLLCFAGLSIDISNRKELLVYNNERQLILKELAETVQKVFFIYECVPKYRLLFINAAYEYIWGYSLASLYNDPDSWLEAVHPEDRIRVEQAYFNGMQTAFDHRYRIINAQGQLLWIHARTYLIKDQTGQVTRIIGVADDITEQWQQQQEAREDVYKFHSLAENINEVCFIYALKQQKFLYVSPASISILGYSPDQFYQDTQLWLNCIHPADRTTDLQAHLFSPEPALQEYRMLHASGGVVWLSIHKSLVENSAPQEDWLIGLAEDISHYQSIIQELKITCRKAQQETLNLQEDRNNLLKVAQIKDEFMASLSHELRTPLGVILNIADLLRQEVYGAINPKQKQVLDTIEESGEHLLALINDVLMLSKIEAGKLKLELEVVGIESICESCLRLVQETGYKKSLSIQMENLAIDAEAPLIVQGEPRRLKQILVNLLSNAIKFTPVGGSVTLRLTSSLEQQMIYLSVIDTGAGISKEEQALLFKPFSQLKSTKNNPEGTGLGLYLVMCLSELHGGQVSINSDVGQGCEFIVALPWYLPSFELAMLENDANAAELEANHAIKIVLIDDHLENLNAFRDYLDFKGYKIKTADNAKSGLALIKQWRAHLVLMDIQMPEMNGLEAIQHLRQDKITQDIKIIALTALASPADQERCFAAGANQYLSKPVSLKRLIETIEQCLA